MNSNPPIPGTPEGERGLRMGAIGGHHRPNQGRTNTWLTPPDLIEALGPFDLDPCAAPEPRPWDTAREHWTKDGLDRKWRGMVWMNPPYGREVGVWMKKFLAHRNGIALVFARTETPWAQKAMKNSDAILFPKGRYSFHYSNGERAKHNSGAPSVFYGIGSEAVKRLRQLSHKIDCVFWANQ